MVIWNSPAFLLYMLTAAVGICSRCVLSKTFPLRWRFFLSVGRVRSLLNAPFYISNHEEGIFLPPIPPIISIFLYNATKTVLQLEGGSKSKNIYFNTGLNLYPRIRCVPRSNDCSCTTVASAILGKWAFRFCRVHSFFECTRFNEFSPDDSSLKTVGLKANPPNPLM